MANITINEISQTYSYNISDTSYACVALPITACWGPGFIDPEAAGKFVDGDEEHNKLEMNDALEKMKWTRFPATQSGLESFISTFRGPIQNYRLIGDNSYNVALTLITAGYDVLVSRLTTGLQAQGEFVFATEGTTDPEEPGTPDNPENPENPEDPSKPTNPDNGEGDGELPELGEGEVELFSMRATGDSVASKSLVVKAKYCGTFGNSLKVVLRKLQNYNRWNIITYIVDAAGIQTAVENKTFVFDIDNAVGNILHISELESNFLEFVVQGSIHDTDTFSISGEEIRLAGGTDHLPEAMFPDVESYMNKAISLADVRYRLANNVTEGESKNYKYVHDLKNIAAEGNLDTQSAKVIAFREWTYTTCFNTFETLEDKLSYNPNRVIVPGWDDQDFNYLLDESTTTMFDSISPLHAKLMEVAYKSRCATAYLDIPKSLSRDYVYSDDIDNPGYAQMLARYVPSSVGYDNNVSFFASNSALFAPWGKFVYTGTSKSMEASPSFLALAIERSMIKNQPSQYEWQLPLSRKHDLKIGELAYGIPKKYLDIWQQTEGVGINCITNIPDTGVSIWGNSTLFEVAPATYQALANLSTRKLVNAVEDLAYRCGISITFQYNNDSAYQSFFAGMSPLLDAMKNVGAIDDYYIRMSEDINGFDQVNLNSVVGQIYLTVRGVINDITIDLIALPSNVSLDQFKA